MLISKTLIGNVHKEKKVKTQKEKERKKKIRNEIMRIWQFIEILFLCIHFLACVCVTQY